MSTERPLTWADLTDDEKDSLTDAVEPFRSESEKTAKAVFEMLAERIHGKVVEKVRWHVRLSAKEVASLAEFVAESSAPIVDIEAVGTGIGDAITVTKVDSGRNGWEPTPTKRDISDYDAW